VTIKCYPDRGARHVIIKVVDNGPGLTPSQLAQLSQVGSCQLDSAAGRRAGGLGLGLPITHQLMAAHGGVLRLSSPGKGAGTTALLRLPVMQAATDSRLRNDFW
jgi:signal transduction histidine kinase